MVVTMIARTILRSIPKSRPEEKAKNSAPVFAALDDQTRLRLVVRLCEGGPMSIPMPYQRFARHAAGNHQTSGCDRARGLVSRSRPA